ncbi:CPBP family intramembrane glutamic endopeptidase [Pontibacillus salipaludis]|uniref:CPBP family intramembrane glutamic endopeptidase n=1 Tax=Pontibacillus salipaludis TaxID=1697394 RepID=UPI001E4FD93F|nr:CPBP family intramembrane glutamic endopeptidase [Pontibacillus salipaludis]
MGGTSKLILKVLGLELLIILFFTINGAYVTFTKPSNAGMQYVGLLPLALGIGFYLFKTKKWRKFFSKNRFPLHWKRLIHFSPLVVILTLLCIGNGGIRLTSIPDLLLVLGTQLLLVAFIEEMVFRGFMVNILMAKGFKVAVLTSSTLFALTHSLQLLGGQSLEDTLLQVTYAFFIGTVLSLLIVNNHSLIIPMAFHGLNNFLIIMGQNNGSSLYNYLLISILLVHSLFLWSKALKTNNPEIGTTHEPAL